MSEFYSIFKIFSKMEIPPPKMQAAIIVPPSTFLDSFKVFPPLGALYIKKFVEDNSNHTVTIIDNWQHYCINHFQVVGFSVTTPQYPTALKMMKHLPPWVETVVGGPHVKHYSTEKDPWHWVIKGDGCQAFLDILNGDYPRDLPDDKNQRPHRDALLYEYKYYLDGNPTTVIMTSRGCPNGCAFCEDAYTHVKLKDPEVVKEEIQECVDLGFSGIMFFDDLFCINIKRVRELCAVIKPFNIKFRCFAHARNFTEEMAKLLADAGCVEIGFGAETLDQKILNTINKQTTVEQIYKIVDTAHKYGIRVKAFLMLGLPGETYESAQLTEAFVLTSGVDDFDITIYYPYKGTRIADNIDDYDLFIKQGHSVGYYKGKEGYAECIVGTSELTPAQIEKWRKRIYSHNKRFKAVVPKPGQ